MATIIEELTAVLGLDVDEGSFNRGESSLSNIASLWTKISAVAVGVGGLLSGVINQETAQLENMASALGVSGEFLDAVGGSVKALGFNFENAADLIEEMNNKLGESKGLEEITPVTEALEILNLKFSDLEKLAPEEQFKKIGNAALALKDQQKAVSAVDILMGGEANKIFGFMRKTGESFDTIIEKQMEMNFQTAESREGAVKMTASLGKLTKLFTSFSQLIAGLLGRYLAPLIDKFVVLGISFVKVIKTNFDLYITKIISGLKILGVGVGVLISYQLVTTLFAWVKAFNAVKFAALLANASILIMPVLIGAAVLAVVALAQDIYTYFASGGKADTALGRVINWLMQFDIVQGIINYFNYLGEAAVNVANGIKNAFSSAFDYILSKFDGIKNRANKIGSFFGLGDSTISPVQNNISPVQNSTPPLAQNVSSNDLPPIPGTAGAVTNNITIDATGMDKDQLNAAIDERTGQQNAIAAKNNSTGMLF